MRIAVLLKDVPDLVEDLELTEEGALAADELEYVPSEWDDQALEEALLVKEEGGGVEVTVVAVDTGDVDGMLYTALAKGADHAVKLTGSFGRDLPNRVRAAVLAAYLEGRGFDLILTGVQAVDDLDGQVAGLVASLLGIPHASAVREVTVEGGRVRFLQEYAGGRMAEMAAAAPVLLGIQAARKPPRYVTVAKVRQVSRSMSLEEVPVEVPEAPVLNVRRLYHPQAAGHAEMWGDDVETVADRLVALLEERKLLKR
ncbi:Electron transfer flavoprotein, beta subunit [Candidatus Hydrogenisulfobacillus filiaventi]|uniref:Electron transfer flavoprotein, beta subunit n=1 Tax=Candidatus Hydrogenisulfobacillus filiaventi TaxID=2707344 RepID=A0A6F8ZGF7_9FIRM|nr:electron transfer flavoprotein subunit beta [Bacillota bacterium]CAB1128682.1 Electron transfer flavoprotein, beta subunit [Candidatus Hydrogenisulfobacillus filiaventi]